MQQSRRHITTEQELREIIGIPHPVNQAKTIDHIDAIGAAYIRHSPFVVIGSYNRAKGHADLSPKGDPPGFVRIRDAKTLVIPERPGNRLADTFCNLLTCPQVSLMFMIPGKKETLRVRGTAHIVIDPAEAENFAVQGKAPKLLLEVQVNAAFLHCGKALSRSKLWLPEAWPKTHDLPTLAQSLARNSRQVERLAAIEEAVREDEQHRLY